MSHLEYRLNRRFWSGLEVVQVVQIGERRWGGCNLDKIQKNSNFFFVKPSISPGKMTISEEGSAGTRSPPLLPEFFGILTAPKTNHSL